MATIRDYLDIADAAYQNDPEGHVPNRWRVRKTETATWYGNGFQGSVFEGDEEVIVAFSGTKGGPMSAPVSQSSANARIAVLVVPNMAGSAKKLVRWAEQNCGGKPVSIVGHSLGGALAQVVGAWSGRPFVSLNGPGMEAHLKASAFNVFKPRQMARSIRARRKAAPVGLCLNVRGDFVGTYGKGYVGEVRELTPDAANPRTASTRSGMPCLRKIWRSSHGCCRPPGRRPGSAIRPRGWETSPAPVRPSPKGSPVTPCSGPVRFRRIVQVRICGMASAILQSRNRFSPIDRHHRRSLRPDPRRRRPKPPKRPIWTGTTIA